MAQAPLGTIYLLILVHLILFSLSSSMLYQGPHLEGLQRPTAEDHMPAAHGVQQHRHVAQHRLAAPSVADGRRELDLKETPAAGESQEVLAPERKGQLLIELQGDEVAHALKL